MTTAAIVTAAGRGLRAGGGQPKQWQMLGDRPVLAHALAAFARRTDIADIVAVLHADDLSDLAAAGTERDGLLPADLARDPRLRLVAGGSDRSASVHNGLRALAATGTTRVLIHDGARPLVSAALIDRVLAALDAHPGAAPALPVTDALWRGGAMVAGTAPRDGLFRAQTPQGFRFPDILTAHDTAARAAGRSDRPAADDVEIARAAGLDVAIVTGDEDNIKITWPGDLARAARLMTARDARGGTMDIRTGNGFDVHRFAPGDHLWLCGIRLPFDRGLQGHSDADVGLHALTDAIYGALAEGDIGRHFPPSDPRWKGAASHVFLSHAAERIRARGFALAHADVTLICEVPKIGPHADAMRAKIARLLAVTPDRISVKATTTEGLGFPGREEGIAAQATATLVTAQ